MSVTATPTTKKTDAIDFPALFQIFCENRFGHWEKYSSTRTFQKIMSMKYEFGNLIFHDLVNFVSKVERVPIKDLLHDFSEFISTYY